jgi:hypothetical protein
MSDFGQSPAPENLQFQKAEPLPIVDPNAQRCKVCQTPIGGTYFHANGQVVCPMCAERIQSGQQKPPATSLATAVIYGAGAALAGCILYAAVAVLLNLELALIAIAVGFMVGKAVRAGSKGLGGRPQQILAVLLTYFSITSSYMAVAVIAYVKNPQSAQQQAMKSRNAATGGANADAPATQSEKPSLGGLLFSLFLLLAAAPFYSLAEGVGGFISLLIIFFGLQQAWRLTGRSEVLVLGPYDTASPS